MMIDRAGAVYYYCHDCVFIPRFGLSREWEHRIYQVSMCEAPSASQTTQNWHLLPPAP